MGDLQAIGYCGQPVRDVFRRVDPPRTVLIDLARLFPREPHSDGRYHPFGLQMHSIVEGELDVLGDLRAGRLVGPGDLPDQVRAERASGDALGAGVDAEVC